VGHVADRDLDQRALLAEEPVPDEDLLRDRLGIADGVRAARAGRGVERGAVGRSPPALAPDYDPRPAMISARPPDSRSSVANCWNTRTGRRS
jgi:hypothetical protein